MITSSRIQKTILRTMPKKPLREPGGAAVVVAMRPRFYGNHGPADNVPPLPPFFGWRGAFLRIKALAPSQQFGASQVPFRMPGNRFRFGYNENEIHFHLQVFWGRLKAMLQRRIDDHAPPSRESVREAQEIFYKHLKRVGLKHTDQRDTILRTFLETRDHLSTDELFRLVRKKDAKVGFTTVYRTLKLLGECGLASAVPFPDGMARYEHQFNRRNHHHMVCTECDASVEFFTPEVSKLEEETGR